MIAVCCLWWAAPVKAATLTAEQIAWLQQNGVCEATIDRMRRSEANGGTVAAEADRFGVNTIVRPDGRPAIVYSTDNAARTGEEAEAEARAKEERAWEMLRHMIVDTRRSEGFGATAGD
jgi:hypothetical protein